MTTKPAATREFVINPYLAVRLEGRETVIYVGGRRFRQCKALVLNIPAEEIQNSTNLASIDEAATRYHHHSLEYLERDRISPEVEFWGHCSNLQAWADNDYDTRLLHSNLAFPLLKALTEAGDSQARAIFRKEVVARFVTGYPPVVKYLVKEKYYSYLTSDDLDNLPAETLIALLGTDIYHLNPKAFARLSQQYPTITVGEKIGAVIKNGVLDARNQNFTDEYLKKLLEYREEIKYLLLSQNQLHFLPEFIGSFTALQSLDLNGNQLQSLPESVGDLTSLQSLILNNNQLQSLPGSIGNLTSLQRLLLSDNQLQSLPGSIGNLTSLQQLSLSNNQLLSLPGSIGNLASLQFLALQGNQLRALPESFGSLASLQRLELNCNQLQSLPESFGNLDSLQSLDLASNQLQSLPESFGNLTSLQYFFLSNNQIQILPECISNLISLQMLDLKGNLITSLPESFNRLSSLNSLKSIDLSYNELKKKEIQRVNNKYFKSKVFF